MTSSRPFRRDDVTFFESRAALRAWLEAHHDTVEALQMGLYRKSSGLPSVSYEEAVEEALCFGWIDGVRHSIDGEVFTQRFTPRRPGSNWSAVNIKRVQSLTELGLMQEAGLREFEARDGANAAGASPAPADIDDPFFAPLREDDAAFAFFQAQAPWYRHAAAAWVTSAKQEATRQRRLEALVRDSRGGQRIAPFRRSQEVRVRERRRP